VAQNAVQFPEVSFSLGWKHKMSQANPKSIWFDKKLV
jgi:hypothetical protein